MCPCIRELTHESGNLRGTEFCMSPLPDNNRNDLVPLSGWHRMRDSETRMLCPLAGFAKAFLPRPINGQASYQMNALYKTTLKSQIRACLRLMKSNNQPRVM